MSPVLPTARRVGGGCASGAIGGTCASVSGGAGVCDGGFARWYVSIGNARPLMVLLLLASALVELVGHVLFQPVGLH